MSSFTRGETLHTLKSKASRANLSHDGPALKKVVEQLGKNVSSVTWVDKDDLSESYAVELEDGSEVVAKFYVPNAPRLMIDSQIATTQYISQCTSIPTTKTLYHGIEGGKTLVISEKPHGVNLQLIYNTLPISSKISIVTQLANYIAEIFNTHRFNTIGSLYTRSVSSSPEVEQIAAFENFEIGPIVAPIFLQDGRANLSLIDRGPFPSVRSYFIACAQRELDCLRMFFTQAVDMSESYKRVLEDNHMRVERSSSLLMDIVEKCEGLDESDEEWAPFSLDIVGRMELENIWVDEETMGNIVCISDWEYTTTRPLWHCARLPRWISSEMYKSDNSSEKASLEEMFRQVMQQRSPTFVKGMDLDHVRQTLEEVCTYDASKDGFFVLPTLESIAATLPNAQDVDGLAQLLDPRTDVGRVARISLATRGSGWTSMKMGIDMDNMSTSPPRAAMMASSPPRNSSMPTFNVLNHVEPSSSPVPWNQSQTSTVESHVVEHHPELFPTHSQPSFSVPFEEQDDESASSSSLDEGSIFGDGARVVEDDEDQSGESKEKVIVSLHNDVVGDKPLGPLVEEIAVS